MFPLILDYLKNNRNVRYTIIGILTLIIVTTIGIYYYQNIFFHATAIDPNPPAFPSSSRILRVTFNKDIETTNIDQRISVTPTNNPYKVEAKGKAITLRFNRVFDENQKISVKLNAIRSRAGDTLSQTLDYTVQYVPTSQQSSMQAADQANNSDSFEDAYPVLGQLPIETLEYTITGDFPNADDPRAFIQIAMNFNILSSTGSGLPNQSDVKTYEDKVRKYRTEAIKKVKSLKGYNDKDYRFVYSESVLLDEFKGDYAGDLE